jgi:hypothetical protein
VLLKREATTIMDCPKIERERYTSRAALLIVALLTIAASRAGAQEPERRLLILQNEAGQIDGKLRGEVDRLVLEAVSERAAFTAYVSPVPFDDVELAAGCSGRDAGCLQRIAATLDADWLLVRDLAKDGGRTYLTLIAHDGPSAMVTRRAVAELSSKRQQTPKELVPQLIERLYPGRGDPGTVGGRGALPAPTLALDNTRSDGRQYSPARIVGWSAAASGGALLVAGVVVGALSRADERANARLLIKGDPFEQRDRADQARDLMDRAERRTKVANGLMFSGAGVGVAGVTALLWEYLRPKRDQRLSVGVAPVRSGLALGVRSNFGGGI